MADVWLHFDWNVLKAWNIVVISNVAAFSVKPNVTPPGFLRDVHSESSISLDNVYF